MTYKKKITKRGYTKNQFEQFAKCPQACVKGQFYNPAMCQNFEFCRKYKEMTKGQR